jgi:hypothetical protein
MIVLHGVLLVVPRLKIAVFKKKYKKTRASPCVGAVGGVLVLLARQATHQKAEMDMTKKKAAGKTLTVSVEVHDELKKVAEEEGLKLGRLADQVLGRWVFEGGGFYLPRSEPRGKARNDGKGGA